MVREGRQLLLLELADRSRVRVPRGWTDADGPSTAPSVVGPPRECTIESLRELAGLVDALQSRAATVGESEAPRARRTSRSAEAGARATERSRSSRHAGEPS